MFTNVRSVKVIEGCTPDNIHPSVFESKEPLILKGLVSNWPIVQAARQSPELAAQYLRQFYTGATIAAAFGAAENKGRIFYNDDMSGFNYERKKTQFDSFLNDVFAVKDEINPPVFYMDSTLVDYCLPGFRGKNDLVLKDISPRISLWAGNKTKIAAHFDTLDNIACVVVGCRRFTLFPPEQLENLYVGPLDFNPAGPSISLIDFDSPDFEKYPKFREALAAAQVANLELGDALFLPSMWWHYVEGLDSFNVLVNYWWRSLPAIFGSPVDALNHALLSVASLPAHERQHWKNLFNYYVFDRNDDSFSHVPHDKHGILKVNDEKSARTIRNLLLNKLNC